MFFHFSESIHVKKILFSVPLLLVMSGWAVAEGDTQRPNIVFVMIDDLGWMDLACQGNPLVETPHIDRFAREGLRFTAAYAAAPVCSPTRAAVITGLAPARFGPGSQSLSGLAWARVQARLGTGPRLARPQGPDACIFV